MPLVLGSWCRYAVQGLHRFSLGLSWTSHNLHRAILDFARITSLFAAEYSINLSLSLSVYVGSFGKPDSLFIVGRRGRRCERFHLRLNGCFNFLKLRLLLRRRDPVYVHGQQHSVHHENATVTRVEVF